MTKERQHVCMQYFLVKKRSSLSLWARTLYLITLTKTNSHLEIMTNSFSWLMTSTLQLFSFIFKKLKWDNGFTFCKTTWCFLLIYADTRNLVNKVYISSFTLFLFRVFYIIKITLLQCKIYGIFLISLDYCLGYSLDYWIWISGSDLEQSHAQFKRSIRLV